MGRNKGMVGKVQACLGCAAKVRVAAAAAGAPHCPKCGRALPWLADVHDADFREVVEGSPLPVLVDFWAPWCGPCSVVAPVVEAAAAKRAGKLKVAKANVDEAPGLQGRFGVQGIPTLAVFKGGRLVARQAGAMNAGQLDAWLDAALGA